MSFAFSPTYTNNQNNNFEGTLLFHVIMSNIKLIIELNVNQAVDVRHNVLDSSSHNTSG